MEKDKTLKLLLSKLNDLENNNDNLRKVTISDLNLNNNTFNKNTSIKKNNKIKSYRMQEEYGEKKFIKP